MSGEGDIPASRIAGPPGVHVWLADLDVGPGLAASLRGTLSREEIERAARFHQEQHRERFIAGRGILRRILGAAMAIPPGDVMLSAGPHGKPGLCGGQEAGGIRFNLSHSGGRALYALAEGREIGADIEALRPVREWEAIADRFFTPREAAALRALPPGTRIAAFHACWTGKEAYLKARGVGLGISPGDVEVTVAPAEVPRIIRVPVGDDAARWELFEVEAGEGYAGAVVVERARGRGRFTIAN